MYSSEQTIKHRHGIASRYSGLLRLVLLTYLALLAFGCGQDTDVSAGEDLEEQESTPQVKLSAYEFVPVAELSPIPEMPNPLIMHDGEPVTNEAQWRERRKEMVRILEDYEYGHMPPPPGNVSATTQGPTEAVLTSRGNQAWFQSYRLSFGPGEALGFNLGVFIPQGIQEPANGFPVLVNLTFSANKDSLGSASRALDRGYAVVSVPYGQLGADSRNWQNTAFFPAYPDYDWRDFSAWAWGLSRAVDYLVTHPQVDSSKIMMTGVSRLAQAVLLAGAFDERVALSAPVAGGMALRFSGAEMGDGLGQGITEVVDQNTYWFGPLFEEFRNQTPKLPCDQHWLLALTAPRLFIMSNALQDPYGRAYAAAQTYTHALPVYEFLNVSKNLGVHFRQGGHGATGEDWDAILDFADQYMLGKDELRLFDQLPPRSSMP